MQQVVTNNEAKYQEVIGALHKVTSKLHESREEPTKTRSKSNVPGKSGIPLELKVSYPRSPIVGFYALT